MTLTHRHAFVYTAIVLFIATVLTAVLFSFRPLSSRAASSITKEKHYESILLEDGDTITSLSDEYRDDEEQTYDEFVSDVCSTNSLSDPDTIHSGCYLLIPVYSTGS